LQTDLFTGRLDAFDMLNVMLWKWNVSGVNNFQTLYYTVGVREVYTLILPRDAAMLARSWES